MASPLEIKIILHYWCHPTPYAEGDWAHQNSPAVKAFLEGFVGLGLLRKLDKPNEYGAEYAATDAARVWVDALCNTPFPVQQWVIPRSQNQKGDAPMTSPDGGEK